MIIILLYEGINKKRNNQKDKKQSAQWHLLLSQKVRAQFEWASQNIWSVTTESWI